MSYDKPESVRLNEQLYTDYKSARSEWEVQAKEDLDFKNGAQWSKEHAEALEAKNQAPIVVNVIEPAVEQAVAMLTANSPRFSSTALEDSDVKTGKVFSDLMSFIWQSSEGDTHLKYAITDYYVRGQGWLLAYFDPYADFGKGEIKLMSLDPWDVYLPPSCKDPYARDADNIIVRKVYTKAQLLDMYPDCEWIFEHATTTMDLGLPGSMRYDEKQSLGLYNSREDLYETITRYSKKRVIEYKIFDNILEKENIFKSANELKKFLEEPAVILTQQGKTTPISDEDEIKFWTRMHEQGGGIFHFVQDENGAPQPVPGKVDDNGIPGSQGIIDIVQRKDFIPLGHYKEDDFIGTKVRTVISIGGVLYYEGMLPISSYPLISLMNHHQRNPYPMSDVRVVRDLQEQINKIESGIIAHAANSISPKWWVPEGSVDLKKMEKELNKAGPSAIPYDPEIGVPIQAMPAPLPNELYKNKADKIAEIERILGIYAIMQGSPQDAPNTYKGTVALDEYGQRRIKSKRADIEGALNVLAKVVIEMIQVYYTEYKVFRLVQPNNLPQKEFAINQPLYNDYKSVIGKINDVTVGKYDMIVVSGSMLPSNRYALAEYYKELLQIGAIDQQEFLLKTEVADVEGVLQRTGIIQKQARQIQALMEEVKRLKGDMQTLTRENVNLNKRVEVANFKASLAGPKEQARKASALYETLKAKEVDFAKREIQMENNNAV